MIMSVYTVLASVPRLQAFFSVPRGPTYTNDFFLLRHFDLPPQQRVHS